MTAALGGRAARALWILLGAGAVLRLAIAFTTYGVGFDVDAYSIVRAGLAEDPLHVYGDFDRWPYPPGYFAWILVSGWLEGLTPVAFHDLIQLPAIAADLALAWIVQHVLGRRGHGERARLTAAACVALGPVFLAVSGYHGQIDSLALLPAVLGVALWEKPEVRRRALKAGLLIGIGGVIKTVPLVAVLALLPHVRSRAEAVTLIAAATAPFVIAFAPFALSDPAGVETALRYRGVPGAGGISLLAQPQLARRWMEDIEIEASGLTLLLAEAGGLITAVALALAVWLLFRCRPPAAVGAALLFLILWAFGVNFFLQYVLWCLPFLLLAGYYREVMAAQAVALPALVLVYLRPWESIFPAYCFLVAQAALLAVGVLGVVALARRIARAEPERAVPPP